MFKINFLRVNPEGPADLQEQNRSQGPDNKPPLSLNALNAFTQNGSENLSTITPDQLAVKFQELTNELPNKFTKDYNTPTGPYASFALGGIIGVSKDGIDLIQDASRADKDYAIQTAEAIKTGLKDLLNQLKNSKQNFEPSEYLDWVEKLTYSIKQHTIIESPSVPNTVQAQSPLRPEDLYEPIENPIPISLNRPTLQIPKMATDDPITPLSVEITDNPDLRTTVSELENRPNNWQQRNGRQEGPGRQTTPAGQSERRPKPTATPDTQPRTPNGPRPTVPTRNPEGPQSPESREQETLKLEGLVGRTFVKDGAQIKFTESGVGIFDNVERISYDWDEIDATGFFTGNDKKYVRTNQSQNPDKEIVLNIPGDGEIRFIENRLNGKLIPEGGWIERANSNQTLPEPEVNPSINDRYKNALKNTGFVNNDTASSIKRLEFDNNGELSITTKQGGLQKRDYFIDSNTNPAKLNIWGVGITDTFDLKLNPAFMSNVDDEVYIYGFSKIETQ